MTLTELRRLFEEYGIHPNKRLGQNFLYDPNMIEKMLRAMEISKKDVVVEVGPGAGALTEGLTEKAKEVWAVEIDRGLAKILTDRLGHLENLHIVHRDVLEWDFGKKGDSALFSHCSGEKRALSPFFPFFVVGNLPYQISSPFIEFVIRHRQEIAHVWITVQWEFARRLVARPGTREGSSLSCFVQMYLEPQILFRVPRTVFFPAPEVDSAFISLAIRSKPLVAVKDESLFFELIRKGYGHRRKTLINTLSKISERGIGRDFLEHVFRQCGLSLNARAEDLTLKDWFSLSEKIG